MSRFEIGWKYQIIVLRWTSFKSTGESSIWQSLYLIRASWTVNSVAMVYTKRILILAINLVVSEGSQRVFKRYSHRFMLISLMRIQSHVWRYFTVSVIWSKLLLCLCRFNLFCIGLNHHARNKSTNSLSVIKAQLVIAIYICPEKVRQFQNMIIIILY